MIIELLLAIAFIGSGVALLFFRTSYVTYQKNLNINKNTPERSIAISTVLVAAIFIAGGLSLLINNWPWL